MKKTTLLLIGILWVFSLNAQLLWKIYGNNIPSNSYLFGTIHAIPKNKFKLSDSTLAALKSCQTIAFETDLNPKFSELSRLISKMQLPADSSLSVLLSKDEYKRLESYCIDSLKIKKKMFKRYTRLKPFFLSSILLSEQLGSYTAYEKELSNLAKKQNISITSLESLESQLNTLDNFSLKSQAQMLMESLGTEINEYNLLLELYLKEDLQNIQKLTKEEMDKNPEFEDILLNQRNIKWLPQIETLIHSNATFIAVGAAHLLGDKGLIKLLSQNGYTVQPVRVK